MVAEKVRSASRDSRSQLGFNRQTGVLIILPHKDAFVTALRKQIWLLPWESQSRTKADSKMHFPCPVKTRCCNATKQL